MDKSAKGHRPSRKSADYISLTWTNIFQCIYININRRLSCDYYILAQIKFFANGFFISTFFGNFVAIIKTFVYIMTVFGVFLSFFVLSFPPQFALNKMIFRIETEGFPFSFGFQCHFIIHFLPPYTATHRFFAFLVFYTKIHGLCTIFAFFFDFQGILGLFSLYCTLFVFYIKPQIHLSCIM